MGAGSAGFNENAPKLTGPGVSVPARYRRMTSRDWDPSLPADRAFVIRFRSGVDPTKERLDGRVDHVVSGRGVRFGTYAEALSFMQRVLTEARPAEEP